MQVKVCSNLIFIIYIANFYDITIFINANTYLHLDSYLYSN